MSVTPKGISGHALTRDEFNLLGMIDSRYFAESSGERFGEWTSSFVTSHTDWPLRVEVYSRLAAVTMSAIDAGGGIAAGGRTRILFTGSALGSISTYFHAALLAERGWLDRCDIELSDLLAEPLALTREGAFDFPAEAAAATGVSHLLSPDDYKKLLSHCRVWAADAVNLAGAPDDGFDVVVAPYIHHHLNLLDKARACADLYRVTRPGGLVVIGDLTFGYEQFVSWLERHADEGIPYALECFIPRSEHQALVPHSRGVATHDGDYFYAFAQTTTA